MARDLSGIFALVMLVLYGLSKRSASGTGVREQTTPTTREHPAGPKPPPPGSGPVLEPQNTGDGGGASWRRSRYGELYRVLTTAGMNPASAIPAALMSRAILSHWSRETADGAKEWNFAMGGIHATSGWRGGQVCLLEHPTAANPNGRWQWYRAFASLREGVAGYLDLIRAGRYKASWDYLQAHPDDAEGWYSRLLRAGYSSYSEAAMDDFKSIYNSPGMTELGENQ